MMFSVFIRLEFFAPHDIKHQGHDAANNQADKDSVQHNYNQALMLFAWRANSIFTLGELGDRGLRDPEARPSKRLRD